MKKLFILLGFLSAKAWAQVDSLTVEQCYKWAQAHYPLTIQKELVQQVHQLQSKSIQSEFLPQVDLQAQATYQSEVTQLPIRIPEMAIPTLSKDQYRATVQVQQLIYDGNAVEYRKKLLQSATAVEAQKLDVELYGLKNRINSFYFAVLLTDQQQALSAVLKTEIQNKLQRMEAIIRNGAALETNADALKAELIKVEQQQLELAANRKAALDMLSELTGKSFAATTKLIVPNSHTTFATGISDRPEYHVFQAQLLQLDYSRQLTWAKNRPRINAFAQVGYGRPGLNMLDNSFQPFYIAGVRLNWTIWNWRTNRNDRQVITLQQAMVEQQKKVFETNTRLALREQQGTMEKLQGLIEKDAEFITIRTRIKEAASSQLDQGVITATDYLTELNAEHQARLNLQVHQLQLISAQIQYATTQGK